jgi:arylsulfatase A-like enzyme
MRGLALVTALAVAACGSSSATETSDLLSRRLRYETATDGPSSWTIESAGKRAPRFVRQEVSTNAVRPTGIPGIFRATLPLPGFGHAPMNSTEREKAKVAGQRLPGRGDVTSEAGPHRLTEGGRDLTYIPLEKKLFDPAYLADPTSLPPGTYTLIGRDVLFKSFTAEAATNTPGPLVYTARFDPSFDPQGDPRLDLDGSSYEGFSVLSGEVAHLGLVSWTPGAKLAFELRPYALGKDPVRLEVALDGFVIATEPLHPLLAKGDPHRAIELPPPPTSGRLSFHVAGGRGAALILDPVISRPRTATPRPDFAIFLADTFRADNLAALGGDPRIAPHMNAFAKAGANFTASLAPASWTLPSQASLLTSLPPLEHGATFELVTLDERYLTLPEVLHNAGWRTVAVTEGGFVVPSFGLDQGFERFIVCRTGHLDESLAALEAELAHDDGRPLFLYFQTFRAHSDYRATPAARAALPELFTLSKSALLAGADDPWDFRAMMGLVESDLDDPGFLAPEGRNGHLEPRALAHPTLPRFLPLYRGGAFDTDAGFGTFLELLDQAGLTDANVVLTSDHGEAFGEHEVFGHANNVFVETLHIPLVLSLPDHRLSASLETPASLIDLGPTFLELADLSVPPAWQGLSLLPALAGEPFGRAELLGLECPSQAAFRPAEIAIHDGPHVLLAELDHEGRPRREGLVAYDLASDPTEAAPVTEPTWQAALFESLVRTLAAESTALYYAAANDLSPEAAAALAAMGYLGGK